MEPLVCTAEAVRHPSEKLSVACGQLSVSRPSHPVAQEQGDKGGAHSGEKGSFDSVRCAHSAQRDTPGGRVAGAKAEASSIESVPSTTLKRGASTGKQVVSCRLLVSRRSHPVAQRRGDKGGAHSGEKGSFDSARCAHFAQDDTPMWATWSMRR